MTEASIKKSTVLEAFLKQREKHQNEAGLQAQKLVNLYRHLALFGDDYLETYNKMLLETPADIQLALSDVMGGGVVRQYLEFLKSKQQKSDVTSEEVEKNLYELEESYLPSVDEVEPYQPVSFSVASEASDKEPAAHSEAAFKSQTVFLEQALAKQNAFLQQALTQMQENLSKQVNQAPVSGVSNAGVEVAVIGKTVEQILEKQNQVLTESLKQIFENSAEITAKQMEVFERAVKNNGPSQEVYPEIEEYIPETYILSEALKNNPVPPRAYHMSEPLEETIPEERAENPVSKLPEPPKSPALSSEDVEILSEIDLPTDSL